MKEFLEKHNLPELADLEAHLGKFDDDESDPLKAITDQLIIKLNNHVNFLEELLHPDSSIVSMQEAGMFSEEERTQIYDLFKRIVSIKRKKLLINISTNEEEKIEYFKAIYQFYKDHLEEMKGVISKAISVWNTNDIKDQPHVYFG